MYDVLVTGAETHQGLLVIRSLAAHRVRMLVVGTQRRSLGFYSRACGDHQVVSSPIDTPDRFVQDVLALVERHRIPYIYPVTEGSLRALNAVRPTVLARAALIAASAETLRDGLDKRRTLEIAVREGVTTTRSFYPTSTDEAIALAEDCGYPVIFKPRGDGSDTFDMKVAYAHCAADIRRVLARVPEGAVLPMMQDYALGPHTQFCCFVERGTDVHSIFQDDTVRMLPMTGGIGARRRSRLVDPQISTESIRLFKAMNWEGCASAQWKGPGRDGRYRFIEVGTRIIASVGSPMASGIDVPWMNYQYFTGQTVDRAPAHSPGQNNRWFRGDTLTVAKYLLGDMQKSGDTLPSKAQVFGSWLLDAVRPGLTNDVESFSDPGPGIIELMSLGRDLQQVATRRLRDLVRPLRAINRRPPFPHEGSSR